MAETLSDGLSLLSIGRTSECQVVIQEACLLHRFARPDQDGNPVNDAEIVERPERLRAACVGIAGTFARLANAASKPAIQAARISGPPFDILFSSARMPLESPAVSYVHDAPLTGSQSSLPYPHQLKDLISKVKECHAASQSEIPSHLSQGDLYLHSESLDAIEGALGALCSAVDSAATTPGLQTRFVSIRPPGHHCTTSHPQGFCFINSVAVAAAHAYLEHDYDRVVIFDIDLHHGNGTQAVAWNINQAAGQTGTSSKLPTPKSSPGKPGPSKKRKRPLKMCYTSLHDILSYPCEDGDPTLVANASVRIDGAHGQYISNVHLEPYTSVAQFHSEVYPKYKDALFGAASSFLKKTQADPAKTMFFISAGLDASEHEYPSMSRHGRRVPTSFFSRFGRDARAFASTSSIYPTRSASIEPKIVACLEGGYSDRAISSGIASLLAGLVTQEHEKPIEWDLRDVQLLEKACFPTPPNVKKPPADWALAAGSLFGLLSRQDRSAWDRPMWKEAPPGIVKVPASTSAPRERERRQVKAPVFYGEASPPRKPIAPPVSRTKAVPSAIPLPLSDSEDDQKPAKAPDRPVFGVRAFESVTKADAQPQQEQGAGAPDPVKSSIKLTWLGNPLTQ